MYLFYAGYIKLLVIGGNNDSPLSSVEVIDLESPTNTCNPLSNYLKEDLGMTVGIVDGLIKSCGSDYDTYYCYDYNPATMSWSTSRSMLTQRDFPRSSFIGGVWLVSGDYLNGDDVPDSTEMWTGSSFQEGPTLPIDMFYHCQQTINSTHVFFVDTYNSGNAYLFDWYEETWTELPPTNISRDFASCGVMNNPDNGPRSRDCTGRNK